MTVMVETITLPERGRLDIEIKLTANIQITPEVARRQVSVFVGNHIADLLHGEAPDLVLREKGVYWRVPVVLSSRSLGRIGQVGVIDVDVESGELNISDQTISEIENHAHDVAGDLHPLDLKNAMVIYIDKMVDPVRSHFEKKGSARQLYEEVKSYQLSR